MSNKTWKSMKWSEIKMGHVIKVKNDEVFPADVILLMTSIKQCTICYF